ncbi:MAG: phosphate ABC transporter permease PstA [Endomicrobium sp.]|jgi:phosphate transport system permease protein|nr:phosphate ABC transporter permease PstA [Endomicrobium sp.]
MIKLNSKFSQKIPFFFLYAATILTIIPVITIIFVIIKNGLSAINWEFLTSMPRDGMRAGGIFPAILGTFFIILLTIIFVFPIGICAAIYLNEYAKNNLLTRVINLAIINLAGIPSVVYGLFGLGVFVIFFKLGVSVVSGALTLSIMELPVVITTTRSALNSVPYSFREASLSLGISRWLTIRHIVLPNAVPGILTGSILSIARISGETAPVLFTASALYVSYLPHSMFDQVMILPYHLYVISTQVPNVRKDMIYATAFVLLILVLGISCIAIVARIYFKRRKKW